MDSDGFSAFVRGQVNHQVDQGVFSAIHACISMPLCREKIVLEKETKILLFSLMQDIGTFDRGTINMAAKRLSLTEGRE
jgi:hypothetical protein